MDPVRTLDVGPGAIWHRMHPITPFLKSWAAIVIGFGIALNWAGFDLTELAGLPFGDDSALRDSQEAIGTLRSFWLPIIGGVVGYAALVALLCYLSWSRTRYCVTDEAVHLASGVISRNRRQARLDRMQAVDVTQPLLARIFGLAKLTLTMAGGSESSIELAYLKEPIAQELRADLLGRAAGLRAAPPAPAPAPAPGAFETRPDGPLPQAPGPALGASASPAERHLPFAPEAEVLTVPMSLLVASLLRSGIWLTLGIGIVIAAAGGTALAVAVEPSAIGAIAGIMIPLLIGVGGYAWTYISTNFSFRIAASPDGLRLSHGLLEKRSQTVPPGRVQLISLTQPIWWRSKGWWRLQMNVAGYGVSEDGDQSGTTLLPVGTLAQARAIVELVLPGAMNDTEAETWHAALAGTGPGPGLTCAPRQARWVDPVIWRRTAFAITERALWLRSGRITRRTVIVPHERTQSLHARQGPIERRLRVGTFAVDSVAGPVSASIDHLDVRDLAALLDQQAARARAARMAAGPELWMQRLAQQAGSPALQPGDQALQPGSPAPQPGDPAQRLYQAGEEER